MKPISYMPLPDCTETLRDEPAKIYCMPPPKVAPIRITLADIPKGISTMEIAKLLFDKGSLPKSDE